jgi:hypothetical protein
MRRRLPIVFLVLTLAGATSLAACGKDEGELEVIEGEPVELGDLSYNVQITRPLNLGDDEDSEYLHGQPRPSADQAYLGVFLNIENEGDSPATIADEFEIRDTQDTVYEPLPSDSPYALELGATVPAEGAIPVPGSTAAAGPIKGAMLLFLIDRVSEQNPPIELEIPGESGETGIVELDI